MAFKRGICHLSCPTQALSCNTASDFTCLGSEHLRILDSENLKMTIAKVLQFPGSSGCAFLLRVRTPWIRCPLRTKKKKGQHQSPWCAMKYTKSALATFNEALDSNYISTTWFFLLNFCQNHCKPALPPEATNVRSLKETKVCSPGLKSMPRTFSPVRDEFSEKVPPLTLPHGRAHRCPWSLWMSYQNPPSKP